MSVVLMAGKVCVITGAASGMGRIAARELAKAGATVVMNDREIDEGKGARDDQHLTTVSIEYKPVIPEQQILG